MVKWEAFDAKKKYLEIGETVSLNVLNHQLKRHDKVLLSLVSFDKYLVHSSNPS